MTISPSQPFPALRFGRGKEFNVVLAPGPNSWTNNYGKNLEPIASGTGDTVQITHAANIEGMKQQLQDTHPALAVVYDTLIPHIHHSFERNEQAFRDECKTISPNTKVVIVESGDLRSAMIPPTDIFEGIIPSSTSSRESKKALYTPIGIEPGLGLGKLVRILVGA